jgi:hypothetical protein
MSCALSARLAGLMLGADDGCTEQPTVHPGRREGRGDWTSGRLGFSTPPRSRVHRGDDRDLQHDSEQRSSLATHG